MDMPAARGDDMRAALANFHAKHYSANLMTAVVLGKEELDELQKYAADAFKDMPSLGVARPAFESAPPPSARGTAAKANGASAADAAPHGDGRDRPLWVTILPLKARRTLELMWFVPSLHSQHKSKPELLVGHVLGHEANGSTLWALKGEGLASELSAGLNDGDHTSNCARLSVSVELTPLGLENVDRVVELVLGGIGHLHRSPLPRSIFDELQGLEAMRFRFADAEPELEYVRRLAISMQRKFEPEETLSAELLLSEFDPSGVSALLAQLTPANVVATLSHQPDAKAEAVAAWSEEPWFGTRYHVEEVTPARLGTWQVAYEGRGEPPAAGDFSLPPTNRYIPTDFTLRDPA